MSFFTSWLGTNKSFLLERSLLAQVFGKYVALVISKQSFKEKTFYN